MMLRHAREAKGLTQEQLAQRAGLTSVHISNVETGKTKCQ
jgi:transcriptional regulator with XRE-family HTH domain